RLSRDYLADTHEGVEKAGRPPLIVVARAFNPAGANASLAAGDAELDPSLLAEAEEDTQVWVLRDEAIFQVTPDGPVGLERSGLPEEQPSVAVHIGRVLLGLVVLLL